jgi:hypothetical protein
MGVTIGDASDELIIYLMFTHRWRYSIRPHKSPKVFFDEEHGSSIELDEPPVPAP